MEPRALTRRTHTFVSRDDIMARPPESDRHSDTLAKHTHYWTKTKRISVVP